MTTYYRICETCKKGMNEGFIYADGTYCSYDCLPISESEWLETYDEESDNYWTTWEDDASEEAELYNKFAKFIGDIEPEFLDDEALSKMFSHILDEEHN